MKLNLDFPSDGKCIIWQTLSGCFTSEIVGSKDEQ